MRVIPTAWSRTVRGFAISDPAALTVNKLATVTISGLAATFDGTAARS